MERKMFGHRSKKRSDSERVPGKPYKDIDSPEGRSKDNPKGYEGKEHVKYKNPGFSSHEINYREDEPKMRSNVSREEMHEMEDNYHMDVPKQTEYTLEKKIKRARMKMDDPDYDKPKPLLGNLVREVKAGGVEDSSGEEEMGPNDMQSDSKERRKKMIAAVTRKKMNKKGKY